MKENRISLVFKATPNMRFHNGNEGEIRDGRIKAYEAGYAAMLLRQFPDNFALALSTEIKEPKVEPIPSEEIPESGAVEKAPTKPIKRKSTKRK